MATTNKRTPRTCWECGEPLDLEDEESIWVGGEMHIVHASCAEVIRADGDEDSIYLDTAEEAAAVRG